MQFALIGEHSDGLEMALALLASGRHQLAAYSGSAFLQEALERRGIQAARVADLEEILANPAIDAVIVAGKTSQRGQVLKRALQSEKHVLCAHPATASSDEAYEAGLIQSDTNKVLLPLLPACLQPAIQALARQAERGRVAGRKDHAITESPTPPPSVEHFDPLTGASSTQHFSLHHPRLIEVEQHAREFILVSNDEVDPLHSIPGWDVLRRLGGEIVEVFALSVPSEMHPGEPLILSGRFLNGILFVVKLLPGQAHESRQIRVHSASQTIVLSDCDMTTRTLSWTDDQGNRHEESWETIHPWARYVELFELAVEESGWRKPTPGTLHEETIAREGSRLGWLDEVRALELDAAVRRSIRYRRSSTLEYVVGTEEASFKGTMTLVGCSMIWLAVILLILSAWQPWLGWLIVPVFGVFLLLQFLRWLVPEQESADSKAS